MRVRLLVLLGIAALVLAGCGGGGGTVSQQSQRLGNTDINPHPRDQLRDGGDLRLPIDSLPNNYNYNEVDGTTADVSDITNAVMPHPFSAGSDGDPTPDPDYLASASLTSTSPQVVTYTLNPKAVWSDGSPITWRDLEASWQTQNGADPAFQTSGTTGYQDIGSVRRGSDDKQAVVTFTRTFAEWKGLFSPLYPASATATPDGFNGAYRIGLPITSGPFTVDSIDQTAKTITLKRDPRWWGTPPKLDRVIFRAFDRSAQPDALANNELDYAAVASDVNLMRRAQTTPGVTIRNAPSRDYWQIGMNGAPGAVLSDVRLRQAVAQGIDRADITRRLIGPIVPGAQTDGNHIYTPGTKEYRDNSDALPYDPGRAQQTLDALGWVRGPNGFRARGGTPLSLRIIYYDAGSNLDIVKSVQNQLARIGVNVVPQALPGNQFDTDSTRGNFDLLNSGWGSTSTPLSSSVGIFTSPVGDNVRQNYGRISSPEVDRLFTQASGELDDAKRADLGNQADRLIWQEAHSVVLYARPGTVAVRSNLANFGAAGLADRDYIDAGFLK